jgi:hypothetical protein
MSEISYHFTPSLSAYFDDKEGTKAAFLAGCLNEMILFVFPKGKDSISEDEEEAMYQYFMRAMSDDHIRHKCAPTRFAYMLAEAYKKESITEDDLINFGKDEKKDDEVLDAICQYDKRAEIALD